MPSVVPCSRVSSTSCDNNSDNDDRGVCRLARPFFDFLKRQDFFYHFVEEPEGLFRLVEDHRLSCLVHWEVLEERAAQNVLTVGGLGRVASGERVAHLEGCPSSGSGRWCVPLCLSRTGSAYSEG
ncbi:Uncharacterized protein FWK35_00017264 [Aphis craccivora]|uniref:Uncharacterized protein n=1 Tax=Aphis craccivora TaxID=307492 RepID=A0A6G0YLY5_APHCR|nr:Uncharacterized protein FWK35_00017264 [Aphis craccivora]